MQGCGREGAHEGGFTLVELLVAIVVVGVLTATAIVGIDGLQNKGVTSACGTTMDAANSASAAFYSISGGTYPQTYGDLTSAPNGHALLEPAPTVVQAPTELQGKGWTLTLEPGPAPTDVTTFSGC